MEGIKKTIAKYLGIKQEDVQLYGLKKGSLIFIFSLPKRVLETRSLLDPSLVESMKKHKVFKLELQDAVTITGNIYFYQEGIKDLKDFFFKSVRMDLII